MALTKSLHTVTAVTRVAEHIKMFIEDPPTTNKELLRASLNALGYDLKDFGKDDPTVAACAKSIATMTGWKK